MPENIITLDQVKMNNKVKETYPELYKDAFRASNLAFIAGGSIILFPLAGAQAFIYGTTLGITGIVIGVVATIILNIVYATRLRTAKSDELNLLTVAQEIYPNAHAYIGREAIIFTAKPQEHSSGNPTD